MARTFALAALVLALCLSRPALADEPAVSGSSTPDPSAATPAASAPATSPPATPAQVHDAVDRAITYLQTEIATWLSTRKCAACHHVPLPLWALGEAEQQGYAIDKKFLADTTESLLGSTEKLLGSRIFPNPADPPDTRPQGRGLNMGLPMLAVAARSQLTLTDAQQQSLRLIADEMIKKQQPDGSWEFFATLRRPPINENQTGDMAWIILALAGEAMPDAQSPRQDADPTRASLDRAIAWYDAAQQAADPQDKALSLLVGIRTGKPRPQLQATIDELLALQRSDGGWGQLADLPGDAYATGQALYALALLGFTPERPEIGRAIDFLVAHQQPDGTWPMTSRATPNGEPGSAKLLTPITCAAASWATLGLARLVPMTP